MNNQDERDEAEERYNAALCPVCGQSPCEWDGEEPDGMHAPLPATACLNYNDGPDLAERCGGPVEYRMPLSGTGRSFPRCDKHWEERLDLDQQLRERYPYHQPADFDPSYAGEAWGEEDY